VTSGSPHHVDPRTDNIVSETGIQCP
jgi:hypothetical protein